MWQVAPEGCDQFDITTWRMEDVLNWLELLDCGACTEQFEKHHICGPVLLMLTEEVLLRELEIASFGHRRIILLSRDWLVSRLHNTIQSGTKRRNARNAYAMQAPPQQQQQQQHNPYISYNPAPPMKQMQQMQQMQQQTVYEERHFYRPPEHEQLAHSAPPATAPAPAPTLDAKAPKVSEKVRKSNLKTLALGSNTGSEHITMLKGSALFFATLIVFILVVLLSTAANPWFLSWFGSPLFHFWLVFIQRTTRT